MRKTSLDCIYELALKDDRVLFIGSDLGAGVLDDMRQTLPDRWLMEGIAEQHIVGMAAGLAMNGFLPYVNTIATFLTRRCFEQIAVDLCLHNLPVTLVGNGGGVVYAPLGPTHQAIEDIAILRTLPNMTVVAPCDADEMKRLMTQSLEWPGPLYIRLAKGGDKIVSLEKRGFTIGKGIVIEPPGEILFVSTGVMTQRAIEAGEKLRLSGINAGILHIHTIKPIDQQLLLSTVEGVKFIVTLEEHVLTGGLGSAVLEVLNDSDALRDRKLLRLGIPDSFSCHYGSQDSLLESWHLSVDDVVMAVKKCMN
jgi:transketolase